MQRLTLEEIQLGLEVYEKYLLHEAYLTGNKQTLNEIKLNFKGLKDLGKKALDKFKSFNTAEKTFVGLLGKLKKETGKEAKEIVNFIRSKAKEYKGKSLEDIQKDIEKLYNEFTGKKVDEALSDTARKIGGFLALALYLSSSLIPSAFASADAIAGLDNAPSIETPVDLEGGGGDPNTIGFDDAQDIAGVSLGGDIALDTVKQGFSDQGVKIKLGDVGGAYSFDTAEFNIGQADIDEIAQDVVDDLDASLDGKDLKKVSIDSFGTISNTPGDQDNNEKGPGNDKLGQLRANAAKKIADKVLDLLKDKYPDADISVGESSTNINSVDGQKEVAKGSKEAASTQVAGVSLNGIETGETDTDTKDTVKADSAKARLIDPKLELENTSRYRALLSLFLPLLINDYEKVMEQVSVSLQLDDTDFPITRGKMEKKLAELRAKENKNNDDEVALKVLDWSIGTSKSPSSLLNNINSLDSKVALGKRQLKKSLRPGQRGQNMGIAGTSKTQGNTGDQATSPSDRSNVSESVILEAKTSFSELPNYDAGKAKSNLGILVPLYAAYWSSEPGKTADGTTLPTGFDIDYVMKQYSTSWRKFEKDYPVITGQVKYDDYVDYSKKGKTPTDNSLSMDAKPDGISKDAGKIIKTVQGNSNVLSKLEKINTKGELQLLLKNVLMLTNQNFAKQNSSIKSYMMVIANQIKALKESDEVDVVKVMSLLSSSFLRNKILNINNKEELKDLIVNVILPNVNPSLRKNLSAMKGAVIGAGNAYKFDSSGLDEKLDEEGCGCDACQAELEEKKAKRDRCLRIADRKFKKPSAYKSGAVVRCRKGKIWKGVKEAYEQLDEKEKETLRTWFKRRGAPGKTGGWVDCNTGRKDPKTGKMKYKPCGRQKGEKRAKYPSCRPTPGKCKDKGKGKTWGKTK